MYMHICMWYLCLLPQSCYVYDVIKLPKKYALEHTDNVFPSLEIMKGSLS